jgi:hypothetical protein
VPQHHTQASVYRARLLRESLQLEQVFLRNKQLALQVVVTAIKQQQVDMQ